MTEPARPAETLSPFRDVIDAPPGPAETVLPSRETIDAPPATTVCAMTLVHNASPANARRSFIALLPKLS